MKKIFAVTLAFFCCIFFARPVQAHVLLIDGSIGAVMHIDPEDDPIARQPSFFFFEFKDKTNKFDPAKCDCQASIQEEGKQIFSQPLFQGNTQPSLSNSSFSYTFPEKNVYVVEVTGKPIAGAEFQPFRLTYNVRVAREAAQNTATSTDPSLWLYILGGGVAMVIIIGIFLKMRRNV